MDYSSKKKYYNINVSYNSLNNWITVGFERKPKKEDLRVFLAMANYLEAYLVLGGKKIIDEKVLAVLED